VNTITQSDRDYIRSLAGKCRTPKALEKELKILQNKKNKTTKENEKENYELMIDDLESLISTTYGRDVHKIAKEFNISTNYVYALWSGRR
jgi:hypothetical protein